MSALVFPGDPLPFEVNQVKISSGVYENNGQLFASIFGSYSLDTTTVPPTLKVLSKKAMQGEIKTSVLPKIGDVIIGTISKINNRQANLNIQICDSQICKQVFKGIIRVQDVRAIERDKILMHHCYKPGDVVRAQVISLGDASAYYLSTAKNELGVLNAKSSMSGENMIPISWEEMICPRTGVKEFRKCARPNL